METGKLSNIIEGRLSVSYHGDHPPSFCCGVSCFHAPYITDHNAITDAFHNPSFLGPVCINHGNLNTH